MPATAPTAAPPPGTITLHPGWDSRMQGGDVTMQELQKLLSPFCSAGTDLRAGNTELYRGVRYLMPEAEAARILNLSHAVKSAERIVAPGFPRQSITCSAYDGAFEGEFNHLELVTDAANHVVCVQLINQSPRNSDMPEQGDTWATYDFLHAGMRASDLMKVSLQSRREGETIIIESRLFQNFGHQHGDHFHISHVEIKEKTKLIMPIQFARLVLHCIQTGLAK